MSPPAASSWPDAPTLYAMGNHSLGRGFSAQYDARNNAVVAACGTRWPRMWLGGFVSFPEVDILVHRTPSAEFDLNENVEGRCDRLDALLRTVDWRTPESSLRELCRGYLVMSFSMAGQPLRTVKLEEWERDLGIFDGMSPTCDLVALAYLWHTSQYSTQPEALHLLGTALKEGFRDAEPVEQNAAIHALAYLVDQLPQKTGATMARQLLAPIQPVLVDALAEPHPDRPDDLTHLIMRSGSLTPALRRKVQLIANGRTAAASSARAILDTGIEHAQ